MTRPRVGPASRFGAAVARPRIGTVLALTAAVVVSLLPAVLARTSASQAVLTGVLAALAVGVAGVLRIILRCWGIDIEQRFGRHRASLLLLCGFAVTAAAAKAVGWQNGLHAAMGMAPAGGWYWLRCLLGAALITALLVGIGRGMRWAIRQLGRIGGAVAR